MSPGAAVLGARRSARSVAVLVVLAAESQAFLAAAPVAAAGNGVAVAVQTGISGKTTTTEFLSRSTFARMILCCFREA